MSPDLRILAVNCGASSVRIALFGLGAGERALLSARCEGIGLGQGRCLVKDESGSVLFESAFSLPDLESAVRRILDCIEAHASGGAIDGVGHRITNGGARFDGPVVMTAAVEEELAGLPQPGPGPHAPELRAVRVLRERFPLLPHAGCFDSAFHRQMPAVAQLHPLPRELCDQGILRFGFHGLSCESLLDQLARDAGGGAQGRIVIAHLGCSASMTAIQGGRSADTTMGFAPNGGLMMGTRSGDLCPGVLLHLLRAKRLSVDEVSSIVNCQSGLLGVSGVSRDMKELLKVSATNPGAARAIELFCYTARKHLGSMAAVLGGLDTLVFTGGIGENAPAVRRGICEQTQFLGIRLDPVRNRQNGPVISGDDSRVAVRVMASNEELMIARQTGRLVRRAAETPRA